MSRELDNLARIGRLKIEPASRSEFVGMVNSARTRLVDAQNESLDPDSRFGLAYGAAHRLRSSHCVIKDIGRKTGLQFSRPSFIHWIRINPTCKFFSKLTTHETWRSMRAAWKLTKVFGRSDPLHKKAGDGDGKT